MWRQIRDCPILRVKIQIVHEAIYETHQVGDLVLLDLGWVFGAQLVKLQRLIQDQNHALEAASQSFDHYLWLLCRPSHLGLKIVDADFHFDFELQMRESFLQRNLIYLDLVNQFEFLDIVLKIILESS